MGIAEFARVTRDSRRFHAAWRLMESIEARVDSGSFPTHPDPIPPGYRSHAIHMIQLNVALVMHDAALALGDSRTKVARDRCTAFATTIFNTFLRPGGRLVELWPLAEGDHDTLLARHLNPGHALECRIYAEDPERGFLPGAGTIQVYREPSGPGIRVDSGVSEGSEVSVHYDSMLAKLLVRAETRDLALERMDWALSRFVILGLPTNLEFLRALLRHPAFRAGDLVSTGAATGVHSISAGQSAEAIFTGTGSLRCVAKPMTPVA
jgi:hypothetical protein